MAENFDADVIIAGAGMAGANLALALKSAGLEPLLIDPVVFDDQLASTFDGRASAIAFASFRQWRTLGLAAEIEPHAQRIEQILVTDGFSPGAAARKPSSFYLRFDSRRSPTARTASPWATCWRTAIPGPPGRRGEPGPASVWKPLRGSPRWPSTPARRG
jgi:2-polyprenyl-6-methoxyphenol hydroxylase-like FAD-dependent oxidoreductase